MNNDAVIAPDASPSSPRRPAAPAGGGAAGKLYLADRPDRIWYAGQRFPPGSDTRDAIEERAGATASLSVPLHRPTGQTARSWPSPGPRSRESGCSTRTLFAYVEDMDYSLRARGRVRGAVRADGPRLASPVPPAPRTRTTPTTAPATWWWSASATAAAPPLSQLSPWGDSRNFRGLRPAPSRIRARRAADRAGYRDAGPAGRAAPVSGLSAHGTLARLPKPAGSPHRPRLRQPRRSLPR